MSGQNKKARRKRLLAGVQRYVVFFLLMAFVITCCMILFFSLLGTTGIELTEDNIRPAAILTFGNVVWLSLLCTIIDGIRRRHMVERPVRRIIGAAADQ